MYAGEAERQLSALAQTNAALASEQYNRKMADLAEAKFLTDIDDKRRESSIRNSQRSGIIGMGKNILDALRGDKAEAQISFTTSQQKGQPTQAPTGKPLLDAVRGYNSADIFKQANNTSAKTGVDSTTNEYMIADKMWRNSHNGEPLSLETFKQMNSDKETNKYLSSEVNKEMLNESDRAIVDAENETIQSKNRNIEAENKRAQMEYERKIQKDPVGAYMRDAESRGVIIPEKLEGSKSDMRKQNYNFHNDQIEYYMRNKMYAQARKAEREWIQNEINIDGTWNDDDKGNYKSPWDTSGPSKEKMIHFSYQGEFDVGGKLDQARNDVVPESVYNQGPAAIAKYMNERNKKQGATAMLTNVYIADKIKGQQGISPESEKVNSDRINQKWAIANQTTEGTKYITDAGMVRMRKSDGTESIIKDKNVITKLKKMGMI